MKETKGGSQGKSLRIDQEIAAPDIAVVETAQDLEFPAGMDFSQIIGGDKGTGMDIGQVNNIDTARTSLRLKGKWIIQFPGKYLHPGGTGETPPSLRIRLGE